MTIPVDYKHIQTIINEHRPDHPVTEAEAAEAFHNLVGFVNTLMEISDERGEVIPSGGGSK